MIDMPTSTRPMLLMGDVMAMLKTLPDECVQCAVTSPPYFQLRDYSACSCKLKYAPQQPLAGGRLDGTESENDWTNKNARSVQPDPNCPNCHGTGKNEMMSKNQIGLDPTPELYVQHLVEIFREVRRILRTDGTVFLNLGDSYAGSCMTGGTNSFQPSEPMFRNKPKEIPQGLKPKDLVGIPWRVAFALQSDGWWLRSDIIWSKPNPMPESVTDRPTKAHEYVFLLTKSKDYYYDNEAVKEDASGRSCGNRTYKYDGVPGMDTKQGILAVADKEYHNRNRRSVWTIATQPTPEAHFATYPEELVEICLKAGTSQRGACTKCGAPWERVMEATGNRIQHHWAPGTDVKTELAKGKHGSTSTLVTGYSNEYQTLGWRPSCSCYGLEIIEDQPIKPTRKKDESQTEYDNRFKEWEWELQNWRERWNILKPQYDAQSTIPCLVLDPFVGSGTTCKVAMNIGRRSIGIDLNPAYIELAKHKCGIDLPALESFKVKHDLL